MPYLNFVDWPYVHLGQCSYPFWVLGGLLFGLAWHLYPFLSSSGPVLNLTDQKLLEMMIIQSYF
jgi:hypothetical protein